MWDFSGDEFIFMAVATALGLYGAVRWYYELFSVSTLCSGTSNRALLGLTPLATLLVLYLVIRSWADPVFVAGHLDYTLLFMAGGCMWLFLVPELFSVTGISTSDDAMRRHNPAAAWAVAGGMMGVMLAYAGSNVGNGPTIWTTLIPAFVATVSLLAVWVVLELVGGAADAITLDHDVAGGIRLAAFLICSGAIFGRAMAGDWYDWPGTYREFAKLSCPVPLMLLPLAAGMNRILAPSPERLHPGVAACGVIPAAGFVVITLVYLAMLGLPVVAPPGEYKP